LASQSVTTAKIGDDSVTADKIPSSVLSQGTQLPVMQDQSGNTATLANAQGAWLQIGKMLTYSFSFDITSDVACVDTDIAVLVVPGVQKTQAAFTPILYVISHTGTAFTNNDFWLAGGSNSSLMSFVTQKYGASGPPSLNWSFGWSGKFSGAITYEVN
jgi:hypothetical protein